ncbi:putative receptor-like protein kinase At4g00960 [Papaver somniferum]|uniref:putative receptor-like protein kinase At4g00960 n=1 Tax=Papaver somniferum TaxID=3469 RepID=UPI000E6F799D|nr:putative receptor-like protein kinase At4g00960 [Papaver somniferum]
MSLAGNSSIKNGYYNATVGRNLDTVYGSFQCRGDVPLDVCQGCIKIGTKEIKENYRCPNSKQAILWYDICMLRYSNQSYFNIRQDRPAVYLANTRNISNPDQFRQILSDFMDGLSGKVASNINGSTKFATGDTPFTDMIKIYGYVQCTEDISLSDCNQGLLLSLSQLRNLTEASRGGQILKPSFNVRFEIYPLFPSITTPSPSPAPLPLVSPPSSTNTTTPDANGIKSSILVVCIVVPAVIVAFCAISIWFFCFQRKKKRRTEFFDDVDEEIQSTESLQFNFSTISAATNNFSEANKLGEGGFGPVYKGTLSNEQHIAVKRLSEHSGQGDREFKNEVTLVAKLQHRNLVKLVGFSLSGEEKLLIYEFMPNASLDKFLFDPIKCAQLDWERRYKIIKGVAAGLVYLHEESRLKIVHRDLKASNILLDKDMNPKIADFGMARLFVLDQTQASTKRIVGTHGYMAPEYVMHGKFSVKSDVFSFGVLVLEILSGRRNNGFHKSEIARDLLSYVWRHWNDGSAIEILDPTLKDTYSRNEAVRCIHVALLCVQENVADRPTMPTVVQMLNTYSDINTDLPSEPAFFADSTRHPNLGSNSGEQRSAKDESNIEAGTWSVNELTVSEVHPR